MTSVFLSQISTYRKDWYWLFDDSYVFPHTSQSQKLKARKDLCLLRHAHYAQPTMDIGQDENTTLTYLCGFKKSYISLMLNAMLEPFKK